MLTPAADRALVELRDSVLHRLRSSGAVAAGVCGVEPLDGARRRIEERRAAGLHGDMAFTFRNPGRSCDPTTALPSARSAVVAAVAYTWHRTGPPGPDPAATVARYTATDAYGELRRALGIAVEHLEGAGHRSLAVADSNALVDRAMAHRAGLGWFGKNTNVLVPGVGSWVVLGTVLTEAELPHTVGTGDMVEDGCGTCRRCLDGCPTGAFVEPGVMDARRCLSWLLQREGDFPRPWRESLGGRIYGCDDCQEVCPPNRRAALAAEPPGGDPGEDSSPTTATHWVDPLTMLAATDSELLEEFGHWYIPRRDPRYLRRNALVVLGNIGAPGDPAARRALTRALASGDDLLEGHAAWAARRLDMGELLTDPAVAHRPAVRQELARPAPPVVTRGRPSGETGSR